MLLRAAETSNELTRLRVHFDIRLLASQGVLEIEGEAAKLAALSIGSHDVEKISGIDWRSVGSVASQQLRRYVESGAV